MVINFLKNAFQFIVPPETRINRSRYTAIIGLCGVLSYIRELYIPLIHHSKLSYFAAATILAHIVVTIIASIKRAHDINRSGGWVIFAVIFLILMPEVYMGISSFFLAYLILITFLLCIIPGSKGTNKFGERPIKSSLLTRLIMAATLLTPTLYILWLLLISAVMYYGSGS